MLHKLIGYKENKKEIKVIFSNERWIPSANKQSNIFTVKHYGLSCLCNELCLNAKDNTEISDNEFDAIMCSLCGVVDDEHLLKDCDLTKYLTSHFSEYFCSPRGYRLLYLKDIAKWPYTIEIEKVDHSPLEDCNDT